ncbi:hypothetical protein ACGFIR_18670 [Micromonospora sp. NPDC049051]|uniref:hypothetical protein n=1 Tax=unclassified Micromonospora TaxID=2617518 RepID=UPI003713695F
MTLGAPLVFLDANILYSRTLRDWISLLSLESDCLAYVADTSMGLVQRVVLKQVSYYRRSLVTEDRDEQDLIAHLRKAGAHRFAQRLEGHLDGRTDRP